MNAVDNGANLHNARNCLDLVTKHIAINRAIYVHHPPHTPLNCPAKICVIGCPALYASRFKATFIVTIGVTTAPTMLSPWIPKNQNNCEINNNAKIDGNDSVALNNGCKNLVNKSHIPTPERFVHKIFNKINPTMFTAIGIKILNGAATFGGTDPGILIVISFETKR